MMIIFEIVLAFQPDKRQVQISFPIFTVISLTSNVPVFDDESLALCRALSVETRSGGNWEIVGKSASGTGSGERRAPGEGVRVLSDEVDFSSPKSSRELALDACLSRRAQAKDA